MSNNKISESRHWNSLLRHKKDLASTKIKDLFETDPARFDQFHLSLPGLLFDFSKNLVTAETIELLTALAESAALEKWRDDMAAGLAVNLSEKRPAWHMAARNPELIKDESLKAQVRKINGHIADLADRSRSDGRYDDIIHIGIGGSDLGPMMVCRALTHLAHGPRLHFVSNLDGAHLAASLKGLSPEKTLFIIASKSFTTIETLTNAASARAWAGSAESFIAITANTEAALEFGIKQKNILPLFSWIGGRFSLWSSISLAINIQIGPHNFKELCEGAKAIDEHFLQAPLNRNIPVIMGLLTIWHRNFHDFGAQAIIPYSQDLEHFPAYLQQLIMESNGKNYDREGRPLSYKTSAVILGGIGSNAQHAFFQLLHQGSDIIPADFIGFKKPGHELENHHEALLASMISQSAALAEGHENPEQPHRHFGGNRPSNTIILDELTPRHLGMLIALYEHKVFVEGTVWGINSFDQWGVELGKTMTRDLQKAVSGQADKRGQARSSEGLIKYLNQNSAS